MLPDKKPASSVIQLPRKARVIQFPGAAAGSPTDPTDPQGNTGGSPALRRLEECSGMVVRQFAESEGDAFRLAKRHGVTVSGINRIVARFVASVLLAEPEQIRRAA